MVYVSEAFYELEENIDNEIKEKALEIIRGTNSEYLKYYLIGKFVHSHIQYDISYHGKNKTAKEIYDEKKGVCEHYTILYNAMLNSIGIKTLTIFGWALEEQTYANVNTIDHAWTAALINGRWIELDATWDLFEGVTAGHILKGFNKEAMSYSPGGESITLLKTSNLNMTYNDKQELITIGTAAKPSTDGYSNNMKISIILYIISLFILLI